MHAGYSFTITYDLPLYLSVFEPSSLILIFDIVQGICEVLYVVVSRLDLMIRQSRLLVSLIENTLQDTKTQFERKYCSPKADSGGLGGPSTLLNTVLFLNKGKPFFQQHQHGVEIPLTIDPSAYRNSKPWGISDTTFHLTHRAHACKPIQPQVGLSLGVGLPRLHVRACQFLACLDVPYRHHTLRAIRQCGLEHVVGARMVQLRLDMIGSRTPWPCRACKIICPVSRGNDGHLLQVASPFFDIGPQRLGYRLARSGKALVRVDQGSELRFVLIGHRIEPFPDLKCTIACPLGRHGDERLFLHDLRITRNILRGERACSSALYLTEFVERRRV